ncbi:MAG TPA: LysM peptidoglycan-binding domain-containing protein [Pyrinomonadaceae bacterium]|jgi:hypothetical protein
MGKSISPFRRYGQFNPQAEERLQIHVVAFGENIDGICHRYWGDRRFWREIADRNNISDPRRLEPGTILLIPEAPVESGLYDSL